MSYLEFVQDLRLFIDELLIDEFDIVRIFHRFRLAYPQIEAMEQYCGKETELKQSIQTTLNIARKALVEKLRKRLQSYAHKVLTLCSSTCFEGNNIAGDTKNAKDSEWSDNLSPLCAFLHRIFVDEKEPQQSVQKHQLNPPRLRDSDYDEWRHRRLTMKKLRGVQPLATGKPVWTNFNGHLLSFMPPDYPQLYGRRPPRPMQDRSVRYHSRREPSALPLIAIQRALKRMMNASMIDVQVYFDEFSSTPSCDLGSGLGI